MFVHKHRNTRMKCIYIIDVVFSVGINNVPSVSKFNYSLESSLVRNSDLEVKSCGNARVIFDSAT